MCFSLNLIGTPSKLIANAVPTTLSLPHAPYLFSNSLKFRNNETMC